MTDALTMGTKFLCGHGLLNAATRGQGVCMSPGLIKPCHFSPRGVMQSLTSVAMVANVLQALTDDSDSVSTASPDSNFSVDSVECNLMPRSESNHSNVTTSKNGGTDAGVPRAMFTEVDSTFGKHPTNETTDEKVSGSPLDQGGDFCAPKNPSVGSEDGASVPTDELLIGDCEIDTELTSKEKTKQWLACPSACLWKDGKKEVDPEVKGEDVENRDDLDIKLMQDSLSGSPMVTPRSSDIDFQDEVEKLATLFTRLDAGSSEEEAFGAMLSQKSSKVKGRASRESLRLPKSRAASSSSSFGRRSPAPKGLYRSTSQRSTGSLDRDSTRMLSQKSAKSLDMRMSTGSMDRECSETTNLRSHSSMHPTSLGSSVKTSSSSVTDHLAPTVSEIERRLTDLIGRVEEVAQGCVIQSDDTNTDHQDMGKGLTTTDSDTEQSEDNQGDLATSLYENKNVPKSSLSSDTGKCRKRIHLKLEGSDTVDKTSGKSTSMEEDSLENVTDQTANDSSSFSPKTADSLNTANLNETSVDTGESPDSTSIETDSLNKMGARGKTAKHSHIAVRQRGLSMQQRQMLFGTPSSKHNTVSMTTSGQRTEYDSDETWTDSSEYRSSSADHVADSERDDSDDLRSSRLSRPGSNRRLKGIQPEAVSGLLGILDTKIPVKRESTTTVRVTPKEKATGDYVSATGKVRLSTSETKSLLDEPIHDKTEQENPEYIEAKLMEDTRENSPRRVRHPTGHNKVKKDDTLTSEVEPSPLDDIDTDSLTDDAPFVSPSPTKSTLTRTGDHVIGSELTMDDFSHLMAQVSEKSHKSSSNQGLFVSPVHSRVIARSDLSTQFLASGDLDNELHSPKHSATQLSYKSESMAEEYRSMLDSASIDDTEDGFVTPDEERSLSPDVEDWLFDPEKPIIADINELNLTELISLSSRSATPLVDSLASELMSPSNQTLVDSTSPASMCTRVGGFVSPDQSTANVSEQSSPVNVESEPEFDVAPQPHSQTPNEENRDNDLEVTSSDEGEHEPANEQVPEKRVFDVLKEERVISPVPDTQRSSQIDSVDQTASVEKASSLNDLPVLRSGLNRGLHNEIFSKVSLYSSDDDVEDKVTSAEPVDQSQSSVQNMTQDSLNDAKQESKSALTDIDLNNCSSGESIAVKDTQSDQGSLGEPLVRSEVSSSEDDFATRTDTVITFGELQKEIADVIGPVLSTDQTRRESQDSAMSDVLKLAFSRSLQTAVTGNVVTTEDTKEQAAAVDTTEGDDVGITAPNYTANGPEIMSRGKAGDQAGATDTDRVFSSHLSVMPVSQHWSHVIEEDSDPRGHLTTVIEQDENSRSSVTSSLSVKSSKSSDIDVSETDSDKNETKPMTMGAWDADISSQSETEIVLQRGSRDSGFFSSTMDQSGNVTILGQSEYSSQENLCKDTLAFSKRRDHVGKFLLHTCDMPPTLFMPGAGNLPPVSSNVGECDKMCAELAINPAPPDADTVQAALFDLTATLGKRENNISRPSTSKTLWKLSRPPSHLAVVTEDAAEEKPPESVVSQEDDRATTPSCDAAPSLKQSDPTLVIEHRTNSDSTFSTRDVAPYMGIDSSVNLSEMNVSTDDSVRCSTRASSEIVESNGNTDESSSLVSDARAMSPVTTERKRSLSGIPLLRRTMKSNTESSQINMAPSTSKGRQKAGQMSTDCKPAAHSSGKDASLSQKVARILGLHQKAMRGAPVASSESSQKSSQRHPSSPVPQTSNYLRAKVSTTDSSCNETTGKKPPSAKLTKSVVKGGIARGADDTPGTVAPARQRYASAGMVMSSSTRTRIPSAVSLRALSYDRNVQARVDSRFATYCIPRQVTSSLSAKDTSKQSRPGKTHSARSVLKLNRRFNNNKSKSPSKRLSKSVDSLDRVERSSARVGRVASDAKATKLTGRKSSSKDVAKEVKGESRITVKLPNVDVAPVSGSILNGTDSIDSIDSNREERESNVGDPDSAEDQSKKPAKAAISIQTEFPPKKGHKKKQKKRTESVKKDKTKLRDDMPENDIQLTTSESDAVDIELAGVSLSKKNLLSRKLSGKLSQKYSAASAKSPMKVALRHCKSDFTSSPARPQSPSEGPQTKVCSPGTMGKRVHYDVEMESSGYETSMTKPPAEQTDIDKPKKDEPEMERVNARQEDDQEEVTTEDGATFDTSELIVFGKALKLLQSPASMTVKSIHVEHDANDDSFASSAGVVHSDMYIEYESKKLNDETDSAENLVEQSPSTDETEDEPAPVRPLPEPTEPTTKISSASSVVDIANIERETRYSDGQIKRDNPREHLPGDTSSDGSLKTKIPGRKKLVGTSKTNLTEVSSTRSDEATSKFRKVQRDKFPPTLTKAISDMVISKTDSITDDIIRQLCKNMPDATQQPSDKSTEVFVKSTPKKDIVPETARPTADVARTRSKKRRCAHSYHSTGTPSPTSSVKSLVQPDHKHPVSGTPAPLTQSDKSPSQPTLTQSSVTQPEVSPVCQPVVTQSGTSQICQTQSNQSGISQLPVLQCSKCPLSHPALTRNSKSPICHQSLTQPSKSPTRNSPLTSRSPTRHLSLLQTGRSPTRQLSPTKLNRSPRLSQLDDVASIQTSAGTEKRRSVDKKEAQQSSEKSSLRKGKKPDFGNNFASTMFPTWKEVSQLFDSEEVRNDSDTQRFVSQSDIVAILQRQQRVQDRVSARKSSDMGQGTDVSPSSSHSDTPEGMSDDKVLDSTLVTAASVIIQTRDIVMQQLTNDGDTVTDGVTSVDGITSVTKNSTKRDGDNKLDGTSRAASLHIMKKDAQQMLTCVTKTSNEILNYMSPEKIDVTTHLLRHLQEEGKDSGSSQTSSDTSLYPTKVEPESWMSLNGWDSSEKHSLTDSDGQKNKKPHKKKHGKKAHKSSLPSPQVKPTNLLVKKLLNISHMSVHIGGEKSGSYISTLHKKNTLKKLMDMKNPRAQVKKLLQKSSQENISLSRKDLEVLKQGSSWRSCKLTTTHSSDRGWRANWDDVATIEPLPVLKKKRSCSSASSIRSRFSPLSSTKKRSQSAINSPKAQLPPASSDVTKLLQKTRAIMSREPLCVDLKQLIGEAVNVTDDSTPSPSSAHTMSPMQRNVVTAEKNSPSYSMDPAKSLIQNGTSPRPRVLTQTSPRPMMLTQTSPRPMVFTQTSPRPRVLTQTSPRPMVMTPFKERSMVFAPTAPRPMVLTPFKDSCFKDLSLSSGSFSSVTSRTYYSAESETSKQAIPTDGKQAASFICSSQSAESNRNTATQQLSPVSKAKSAKTEPVKAQAPANNGGDVTNTQQADERMTILAKQQVTQSMSSDNRQVCSSPKLHSCAHGRRHTTSGRSKTSASIESISWPGKKPFSARSSDNFSTCSLNITPGRYSSSESMENNLLAAERHSSGISSPDSAFSDRRDKQVTFHSHGLVTEPIRGNLSTQSASSLARADTTVKMTPQEEPTVVTPKTEPSTIDDVIVEQQETVANKETASAFSLSSLPKMVINLGSAAMDRLLPLSIRNCRSPEADTTDSSALSPGTSVTSAPPKTQAAEPADSKASTLESSAPKSSLTRTQSQSRRKMQPATVSKGVKFPSKDSSASKKLSLSDLSKPRKESTQRAGKLLSKKLSANAQVQRSSTTAKKPPQKKRQGAQRKPATKGAGPRKPVRKVLSLDNELNILKNMLNSELGSSSESLETLTSSKISTTSVPSSTDDFSLSEATTDQSASPMTGKASRRMGRAMSHLKKSLAKGRHAAKDRGDRGEPQMRDTTTDPMFAWHYNISPNSSMPCSTLPYPTPQVDLQQYMSSCPYAASSEIVQSLAELENFISELSSLVDSKGLYQSTEEPQLNNTKLSAPNSPTTDEVYSFSDIATFASNLSTSFNEITYSASVNAPEKVAWKENMRAKALLHNTHLGRIYLQQMAKSSAVREALDIAKIEQAATDNNDEFSDDQFGTTDCQDSSSSLSTSTGSQASVITPRQNKPSDNKHGVKKSEVDRRPTQLSSDNDKDSCFDSEASNVSCPVKREHEAMHDSTQDNCVEDSMHSATSEIDVTESLSFITDSGDELPEVTPVSSNPCVNASSEQRKHSSNGEARGVKRKGTMALEKIPSKDFSPNIFFKPSALLSQMPELKQLNRNSGSNLVDSSSDTKNRFILRASSETSSSTLHSGPESTAAGASKQLSEHDVFNLFFTYLGPEKAHAYLEKSASLSSSVKPMSAAELVKSSAIESMCPSRGSSLSSNNTAQSGFADILRDGSHVSSYSKPSSHLSPQSLRTDSLLMRDAMHGDSVRLPSAALLKKVEMFYDQKMNGTGNDQDLSQFMQWLHSGNSSGSPAERALHSALRFYQSRPDGDVHPVELTALTPSTAGKPATNENKQYLADAKQVMNSALH